MTQMPARVAGLCALFFDLMKALTAKQAAQDARGKRNG